MSTPGSNSYTILLEQADDGGWGAWSPDLPGCVALGDSIEEAVVEMREAIAFHLKGLAADGEPIPEPTGPGIDVRAELRRRIARSVALERVSSLGSGGTATNGRLLPSGHCHSTDDLHQRPAPDN